MISQKALQHQRIYVCWKLLILFFDNDVVIMTVRLCSSWLGHLYTLLRASLVFSSALCKTSMLQCYADEAPKANAIVTVVPQILTCPCDFRPVATLD